MAASPQFDLAGAPAPDPSALVRIDAGSDDLVIAVQGPLDAATGRLLHEALLVSDDVAPGSGVVVDLGQVGPVTSDGLRALVDCAGLAADVGVEVRFRFGGSRG